MAFFEDVGKKLSQTGQDVAKKTKNFADTTKLSAMISEEENKIDSLCLRIGRRYCEICEESADPQLCEMAAEVMQAKEKIGEYRLRIAQIKEAEKASRLAAGQAGVQSALKNRGNLPEKCASCGAVITERQRFCTNCGAEIQRTPAKKKCPQCGKELPGDACFCSECGATIE